jgi:large subunit ribosomal protein L10
VDRAQKADLVGALHKTFAESTTVVVTRQVGLTVAEVDDLRNRTRAAGARYKVTKNRLARLALKGTQYEDLDGVFTGPTAVATSLDPVAAAKVVVEFANKNEKLTIVAGSIGGKMLDVEQVKALAKLPSLDELRGKLIGLLQAPAGKIARLLQTPGGQLARVLAARAEKEG